MEKESKLILGFSSSLLQAISDTILKKQQVLIYLNRVGLARKMQCQKCSWQANCKNCSYFYILLSKPNKHLRCRLCNKITDPIFKCPVCGHSVIAKEIGTERIMYDLEYLFPQNNIVRLDSYVKKDFTSTLNDIQSNKVDIIVGTQIISKGHDFSNIALVGIIDIDAALHARDWYALENCVQLIYQVSGRAGRNMLGKVMIQTRNSDHTLLRELMYKDYNYVAEKLLERRKSLDLRPFMYLAYVYSIHSSNKKSIEKINDLYYLLKELDIKDQCIISMPQPCIIKKVAKKYNYYMSIKTRIPMLIQRLLSRADVYNVFKWQIHFSCDVDPLGLK
jgi:primosomal protein N' (replication factor Y)